MEKVIVRPDVMTIDCSDGLQLCIAVMMILFNGFSPTELAIAASSFLFILESMTAGIHYPTGKNVKCVS